MRKTVVINAVGLTGSLLGPHTPRLKQFAANGAVAAVAGVLPAVTTTVQSTYLTGVWPTEHGIVGNGWYFRDECEIKFWRQSNKLVGAEKIWEKAKRADPQFTCANLFWWYNMYSSVDYAVTPRPMYPADGRKIPDIHTAPTNLRAELQSELGQFPLFQFWGPATSIRATQWIAQAALWIDNRFNPTLSLIYLPHLDYGLQRHGPDPSAVAADLQGLDAVCGQLIDHYHNRGAQIIILSEYGMVPVCHPIHLNRVLRQAGLLAVREELGRELLDPGASAAFAVADHQVAHVYVNDLSKLQYVKALIASTPGVGGVLDDAGKREFHLDHPRSGELIALADRDAWFTYYYWLDDGRRPDFAATVDIHRKPGYDPAELFLDPALKWPQARIAWTLARKKLGFRALMQVIPTDGSLVRGSHGLEPSSPEHGPILMTSQGHLLDTDRVEAIGVHDVLWRHLMEMPSV
jgi:predicted AlkP superfamily pyrophosphatase or phosphodiesterase